LHLFSSPRLLAVTCQLRFSVPSAFSVVSVFSLCFSFDFQLSTLNFFPWTSKMKPKKQNPEQIWKQLDDLLVPRLGSDQSTAPPIVIFCGIPAWRETCNSGFPCPGWHGVSAWDPTRPAGPCAGLTITAHYACWNAATPVTSRKCACPKRFSRTFPPESLRLASSKASSVRASR